MHFYATELQKAEKRMRNMAHMEARGRIASAILDLAQVFGVDKNQYITVPVTRQDIASYAGTTYETVFKFFTEFSKAKVLTTSGKKIRINQQDLLKKLISNPK
jgi:CRP/FNR family transcriptional regulator